MLIYYKDVDFEKNDFTGFCEEIKSIIKQQNEDYLDFIKEQEESIIEKDLNKEMEQCFATLYEDVRQERGLILLISLTGPDLLKQ